MKDLESAMRALLQPQDGQFPRPWYTTSTDPAACKVFVVGANQRHGFPIAAVGDQNKFIDALFNRGPQSCREMYERISGSPSPTRKNLDDFVRRLANAGVKDVLQTNVVCFSTPMSADLLKSENRAGAAKGKAIFLKLLQIIEPRVLVVHGSGAAKQLGRAIKAKLPNPPSSPSDPVSVKIGSRTVFVIRSLAPPGYTDKGWPDWKADHLNAVAKEVAKVLDR